MAYILTKEDIASIKNKELKNKELIQILNSLSLRKILELYPVLPEQYRKNKSIFKVISSRTSCINPVELSYGSVQEEYNIENLISLFTNKPSNKNLSLLYKNIYSDINYYLNKLDNMKLDKNFYIDVDFFKSLPITYLDQILDTITTKYNHVFTKAEDEYIRSIVNTSESELKKYVSYIKNRYNADVNLENNYLQAYNIDEDSPMVVNEEDNLTEYFIRNYALTSSSKHTYISEKVCSINDRKKIIESLKNLYRLYDITRNYNILVVIVKILCEIYDQTIINDIYKSMYEIFYLIYDDIDITKKEKEKLECIKLRIEYMKNLEELENISNKIRANKKELKNYGL